MLLYPIAFPSELLQGCCVGVLGVFFPLRLCAGSPVSLTHCPSRIFFLPSTLPPFCNPSCLFSHTWILNWAANRCVAWTLASQESYVFWVFGVLLPSLYGSHVVSVFLTSNTSLTCSCQGKLKMWLTFHLAFQPEVLATKLTVITVGSPVANKHFWNISSLEKRPSSKHAIFSVGAPTVNLCRPPVTESCMSSSIFHFFCL